jgi:hypothetical protein
MPTTPSNTLLASKARRGFVEGMLNALPTVTSHVVEAAKTQLAQPAEHGLQMQRRDLVSNLGKHAGHWLNGVLMPLRAAVMTGQVSASASRPQDLPPPGTRHASGSLTLVDDATIEGEIISSKLALAMMDRASWEFTDLRSRMLLLEGHDELDANDVMRPHVLARLVSGAWRNAGLTVDEWRLVQANLHDEFAHVAEEAYHETNRFLLAQKVMTEIDLRPFIKRSRNVPFWPSQFSATSTSFGLSAGGTAFDSMRGVADETRLMTRAASLARGIDHAEQVLGRLNRLISRQLPGFAQTEVAPAPASPELKAAIANAQQVIASRFGEIREGAAAAPVNAPALVDEMQQRKAALKQAAQTPVERATIEIVALLFQSILTEDRIPPAVRVWFARLQMPVLRVAVGEPDFFATTDHPARRLIDRMGACVMGFDASTRAIGDALEKEIKRVVQVVEAYPDTGRRVFQTVLTEFERFLEHYFKNENAASKVGVSLAQQVEQRETLAIQYTIELRKMLNDVPVQDGVREFLFHVWADVLAMTGVKHGLQSEQIRSAKSAATDLIWSASAKVSREERAEVIRRLPPLLKTLREGMASAGLPNERQEENLRQLNNSLAAAFTAKTAAIPTERLQELKVRLETLEEMLNDGEHDFDIDESFVLDLSGHETRDLEVVGDGGSMPTPAMLTWAKELQVGAWYMLDYRNRNEAVQLAWQGMKRELSLFVAPQGRCVLFQRQRLAAFLQAGLLVPAQDESLTVRATRSALAKLDGDPSRLLT